MRRFGRPVGSADSLSFIYFNEARNRTDEDHEENQNVSSLVLTVASTELYAIENSANHHTDKYELVKEQKTPVLRRSDFFYMAVRTKQVIDLARYQIKIIFQFGQSGSVPKGTKVVLEVTDRSRLDRRKSDWDIVLHRQATNEIILKIQIGCVAPVGIWQCRIETSIRRDPSAGIKTHSVKTPFYILFNPYSKDDSVYMPAQGDLVEYVQNQVGKVWKGGHKNIQGRPWLFGQFSASVLPACCFLLDRRCRHLRPDRRGDPVRVVRAISAAVNSTNDCGVLEGCWAPPYDSGTAPWEWSGSKDILEEYMASGGTKPVRYGQCWVFSAVVVTICRALGLPCRSVTNYVSAHDTNTSLTIDKFFSEDGDELTSKDDPDIGHDSIWNFHVWNDVWMARPDLPSGYGGWQAVDSTPQEVSDYMYQCGPAPLVAVRRGDVGLGFDVPFIFTEVNADVCHFVADKNSSWGFSKTKLNTYLVGKLIVTKAVGFSDSNGNNDAEDITWQYKNKEGSQEERLSVFNAIRGVDKAMRFYEISPKTREDVFMDLVELDKANYGDPYKARVVIENRSSESRTLNALLSSSSVYYTGIVARLVKKAQGDFVLAPRQKDTLVLTVYPEDYMTRLVDYCMLKIYALIRVKETNQMWSDEDDFVLEKPTLKVEVIGGPSVQRGRLFQVQLSFTNQLSVSLTRCRVSVECDGPGSSGTVRERCRDVAPTSDFSHKVFLSVRNAGAANIVATFAAEEMVDVHGSCVVTVKE